MTAGLPLMENMLMPLANNVSISLTAAASATDAAIQIRIKDQVQHYQKFQIKKWKIKGK